MPLCMEENMREVKTWTWQVGGRNEDSENFSGFIIEHVKSF